VKSGAVQGAERLLARIVQGFHPRYRDVRGRPRPL